MRRVPIVPTLIVGVLIAVMLALGFWQLLDRAPKKEAYLAQLAQNPARAPVAFPQAPDDRLLFRRDPVARVRHVTGPLDARGNRLAGGRRRRPGPGLGGQQGQRDCQRGA